MRDIYMLEAIADAKAKSFLMAGVGDNHLQHLKPALDAPPLKVPNITYKQFLTTYSQDAF